MCRSFASEFMSEYKNVLPDKIEERFEPLQSLGKNDYSEVVLLEEKTTEKLFVMRCCNKSDLANVAHESKLLFGLQHEGIPHFEPEIEQNGTIFTLREYVEGVTLEEYLTELNPVGFSEDMKILVDIIIKLCDILAYLHSQPEAIIHRDIKPSNIIVNPRTRKVTLIDFGISRKYSPTADSDTFFFGTQHFAPPEQYGFAQTDGRADIYSIGVMLRYILTRSHARDAMVLDKSLSRIINHCTAFSPKDRYKSVEALKKDLLYYQRKAKPKKSKATYLVMSATVLLAFGCGFYIGYGVNRGRIVEPIATEPPPISVPTETTTNVPPVTLTSTSKSTEIAIDEEVVATKSGNAKSDSEFIERAVRRSLGKGEDEPITDEDIRSVNELYFIGEKVAASDQEYQELRHQYTTEDLSHGTLRDISDIAKYENLTKLIIMGQPLSDLSPLVSNQKLDTLLVMHCKVRDVSPLVSLPLLNELEIFSNPLEDFSVFQQMKRLRGLNIGDTPLSNLAQLGDISHIKRLVLQHTDITSLDGIEKYTQLVMLGVGGTAITDLSPLDNHDWLEQIEIDPSMEQYLHTLNNTNNKIRITVW